MKKVFIKYNPYKLITEITVDEKPLFQNSKLIEKAADGCRMQEWIEEMPKLLVEEYNDDEFDILSDECRLYSEWSKNSSSQKSHISVFGGRSGRYY